MEAMIEYNTLKWAIERAHVNIDDLSKKLPVNPEKIKEWIEGVSKPTFKQAQKLAEKLHIPFGYLFLSEPPQETLPIPDFRTIRNEPSYHPSVYLTELLYDLDRKQQWYREYMIENGYEPLSFVGSASLDTDIEQLSKKIKNTLKWETTFQNIKNKEEFIYTLCHQVENIGILVMRSSYAGTSTHNTIAVEELRGLAIADEYAPLIFINSSDTKSAQVFTLAHELVHIWIGQSAISDIDMLTNHEDKIEKYCNAVAAEMLIPKKEFLKLWEKDKELLENCKTIARYFLVSDFVPLKRAYDFKLIDFNQYKTYYELLIEEWNKIKQVKNKGGNYYNSKPAKESKRFATAVIEATLEGKMLYRDAMGLLNIKSTKTFKNLAKELGVG